MRVIYNGTGVRITTIVNVAAIVEGKVLQQVPIK
jgi:hypothetical protein